MVNIVRIVGKEYMVDVGFGLKGATEPMLLEHGHEVESIRPAAMRLLRENLPGCTDPKQRFWIFEYRTKPEAEEGWRPIIAFTEVEFLPPDYEVLSFYTSQDRKCWFTYTLVAAKYLMEEGEKLVGVVTLMNSGMKRRIGSEEETVKTCSTEAERLAVLEEYFGIKLSEYEKRGIMGMNTQLAVS